MIKRVCLYCESVLGFLEDSGEHEDRISHGVCRSCLEEKLGGTGDSLDEYLDSLQVPVFVVDNDCLFVTANKLARKTVSMHLTQITGHLGGEVFGCIHAGQPGGCGKTIHCQSCAIRNTIMKTFETGVPSDRVHACMDLDTFEGPRNIRFLISTEKTEDLVLLRIEDAQPENTIESK